VTASGPAVAPAAAAPTEVDVVGGGLFVGAEPGTENQITLSYDADEAEIHVTDTAGVFVPLPSESDPELSPCRQVDLGEVACPHSAITPKPSSPSIGVVLGDGADSLSAESLIAGLGVAASGGGGRDIILGSPGDDILLGSGGSDKITGSEGDDVLGGEEGNDVLRGESEGDILGGGPGQDRQYGGAGKDWIWTADRQRDPVINCGPGRDRPAIVDRGKDPRPKSC
jgi:hypothetical protein